MYETGVSAGKVKKGRAVQTPAYCTNQHAHGHNNLRLQPTSTCSIHLASTSHLTHKHFGYFSSLYPSSLETTQNTTFSHSIRDIVDSSGRKKGRHVSISADQALQQEKNHFSVSKKKKSESMGQVLSLESFKVDDTNTRHFCLRNSSWNVKYKALEMKSAEDDVSEVNWMDEEALSYMVSMPTTTASVFFTKFHLDVERKPGCLVARERRDRQPIYPPLTSSGDRNGFSRQSPTLKAPPICAIERKEHFTTKPSFTLLDSKGNVVAVYKKMSFLGFYHGIWLGDTIDDREPDFIATNHDYSWIKLSLSERESGIVVMTVNQDQRFFQQRLNYCSYNCLLDPSFAVAVATLMRYSASYDGGS